jgi:hypothetical protein
MYGVSKSLDYDCRIVGVIGYNLTENGYLHNVSKLLILLQQVNDAAGKLEPLM